MTVGGADTTVGGADTTAAPRWFDLEMPGRRALPARRCGEASGRVAILLHGFPDTPFGFDLVARHLADAGWLAIAPWLHGPGGPRALSVDTATPLRGYQIADLGDEANAIGRAVRSWFERERRPLRELVLVGHDWGAVATWIAVRARDAPFDRAVALSVPAPLDVLRGLVTSAEQRRRSRYMVEFQWPGRGERALSEPSGTFVRQLWSTWSPGIDRIGPAAERALSEAIRHLSAPVAQRAALGVYRALLRSDRVPGSSVGSHRARVSNSRSRARSVLALTRSVHVPTLVAFGTDDGCIGAEVFAPIRTSIPIPNAGHFLALEAPAQVAALVLEHGPEAAARDANAAGGRTENAP